MAKQHLHASTGPEIVNTEGFLAPSAPQLTPRGENSIPPGGEKSDPKWHNNALGAVGWAIVNFAGSNPLVQAVHGLLQRQDRKAKAIDEHHQSKSWRAKILAFGAALISWASIKYKIIVFPIVPIVNVTIGTIAALFGNQHYLVHPVRDIIRTEKGKIVGGKAIDSGIALNIADPAAAFVIAGSIGCTFYVIYRALSYWGTVNRIQIVEQNKRIVEELEIEKFPPNVTPIRRRRR
jgi:hypothetical protein